MHIEEILNDAYWLLSMFYSIIRSSALHVYHMALSFTPPDTHLHQTYSRKFPNWIIVMQGIPQHWSCLVAVLCGHSQSVNVLTFLPIRSQLASGLYDKTARLWDGASGVPIATLEGHSPLFLPDGSWLASRSDDNTVRLWDGVLGVPIATLKVHSPLPKLLWDQTTTQWDCGIVLQEYQLPPLRVTHILISLYHSHLMVLNLPQDWVTTQWDCGTVLQEYQLPPSRVTPVQLPLYHSCPTGPNLPWDQDKTVRLWDCASGVPIATLKGRPDAVVSLSFTPDRSWLTLGSYKTVRM